MSTLWLALACVFGVSSFVPLARACGSGATRILAQLRNFMLPEIDGGDPGGSSTGRASQLGQRTGTSEPETIEPSTRLSTPEGEGLKLLSVAVESLVEGPLAVTELRLAFDNPWHSHPLARFDMALPAGAAVTRFATRCGDRWDEAEVVERHQGESVYKDRLHAPPESALQAARVSEGFSTRVIRCADAVQELLVAYVQEVHSPATVLALLHGLAPLRTLDVDVRDSASGEVLRSLKLADSLPPSEITILPRPESRALRSGSASVARVVVPELRGRNRLASTLLLVDTSASERLRLRETVRRLEDLVAELAKERPSAPVGLAVFDQTARLLAEGQAKDHLSAGFATLRARGALGATDLGAALRFLAESGVSRRFERVVLATGGDVTTGATERQQLTSAVARLGRLGVRRFDVVTSMRPKDDSLLRSMVTAGLPLPGTIVDERGDGSTLLAALERPAHQRIDVAVPGATWRFPRRLVGVRGGEEVTVYAELAADRPLHVALGGSRVEKPIVQSGEQILVDHAIAGAKVQELTRLPTTPERQTAILELSLAHRLLGPLTTIVGLELLSDYERFGFTGQQLEPIFSLSDHRVVTQHRDNPYAAARAARVPIHLTFRCGEVEMGPWFRYGLPGAPRDSDLVWNDTERDGLPFSAEAVVEPAESAEDGSAGNEQPAESVEGGVAESEQPPESAEGDSTEVGTAGQPGQRRSRSAQGTSQSGYLSDSERATDADWSQFDSWVIGRLPPESIRRIIRANWGRFRGCYREGLLHNPRLEGRVNIRFQIRGDGQLAEAFDSGSTLPDDEVRRCIVRQFWELRFPEPPGGYLVTVVYPLVLTPDTVDREEFANDAEPRVDLARPIPALGPEQQHPEWPRATEAYRGRFGQIMTALRAGLQVQAEGEVNSWLAEAPRAPLAWIALGEVAEAEGDTELAERAYGALMDLYSSRPDLHRYAGIRLERIGTPSALALVVDTYRRLLGVHPARTSGYHLLALALVKQGRYREAFAVTERGLGRAQAGPRSGMTRVLAEDLGLIAAAWAAAEPSKRSAIERRSIALGGAIATEPSTRSFLVWESDVDVDLHAYSSRGDHAYAARPVVTGVGQLVTDSIAFGPELLRLSNPLRAGDIEIQAQYRRIGPLGFELGSLEVVEHDGRGRLQFATHPYVVMRDQAFVELASY